MKISLSIRDFIYLYINMFNQLVGRYWTIFDTFFEPLIILRLFSLLLLQNCSTLNTLSGGVLKSSGMSSPAGNYLVDSIMAGGSERKPAEREYIIPAEEDSDDDNDVEEISLAELEHKKERSEESDESNNHEGIDSFENRDQSAPGEVETSTPLEARDGQFESDKGDCHWSGNFDPEEYLEEHLVIDEEEDVEADSAEIGVSMNLIFKQIRKRKMFRYTSWQAVWRMLRRELKSLRMQMRTGNLWRGCLRGGSIKRLLIVALRMVQEARRY